MGARARFVGISVAALSVAALIPLTATPAGAVSAPEVVAEGLNNPYKMSFGPDGKLYVAEGGLGDPSGEGPCLASPEGGGEVCVGNTGSVTQIDTVAGTQARVATGLPSTAAPDSEGNGAGGPTDVAVDGQGNMYVTIGLGGSPAARADLGADGARLATIMKVTPQNVASVFADLGAFEEAENPDADQPDAAEPDSNPFAIEAKPGGGFWAVDAGGNDVLSVSAAGEVSLDAVLPFGTTEAPPFLGLPPGTMIPYQPVPTSITNGAAGLLVTQLTGFPFPVGKANVYDLHPGTKALTVAETGFTNVVDAAQAPDGTVYVLEFAAEGLLAAEGSGHPPTSRLTQIRTDGTRKVLLQDELFLSNGVAVGPDGMVYVSTGSQLAGAGTVIRVDPSVARDPAAAPACAPDDVPGAGFTDVGGNVHREAIDCLAWWGIVGGTSDTTFAPQATVRRDQTASIVARLLEAAGVEMLQSPDAFTDDQGNTHEFNINALVNRGVINGRTATTFAPAAPVTRGQVAALLARAYEEATGGPLPAGDDAFSDDDGSTHEAAINAVAAAGWVNGRSATTFDPGGNATRAQLASMVARMLGTLVDEGVADLPA